MAVTAAIITGVATTAGAPLANFGLQELKSKIENHTSLVDMHKALNDGLDSLLALRKDRDVEVESDVILKDTTYIYRLWMDRVSKIEKEVASLNEKYDIARKNKMKFWTKWGLISKEKIKRALEEVIRLIEECPEKIVVDKLPERVIKEIGVPSIEKYSTLKKALQDVQALLQSDGVKCVALHGKKGVGKTTIMQHLNNFFYDNPDNKEFDMVIFIKVVTDEQTIEDLYILQKIADRVNVDRQIADFDEVARRIQKVLENKRYLLILDGVRSALNGIWEKLDISNDIRDSKVVITTYFPLALMSSYVDQKVELKPLLPKEALIMFQDIVGDNHLSSTARLLCNRLCSCLPLLINPIARSFKYQESPIDWRMVLKELMPWPQVKVDGLEELFLHLKICYEPLSQCKQKCFLYTSLYPANSNIYTEYLVECCIVQGFLDDADADKYSEMRRRAIDIILRHLVNVAFLEEGERMRYVKMNDFYRQFALYISSRHSECKTYVDDEEHEEPYRSKSWQLSRWVSMVGSVRKSLPENQNCGSPQTVLLLQKNKKLVEIPLNYFERMGNLVVLNLYGNEISKLPSLEGLTGLKALYLNGCSKLNICSDEIQSLQDLEVFDIRGIKVDFVPCLKSLRCLRISYIPSNDIYHGISNLHKLEELTMEGCNQMANIINGMNNTLPENSCLLSNMEQLHLDNLQHAIIVFKGPLHRDGNFSMLHTLKLKNTSSVFNIAVDDFPELHNLVVQDCPRVEVVIEFAEPEQSILPKLKKLILDNLSKIQFICSNENLAWSSLEELHVRNCPELRALPFNTTNATNLRVIEGSNQWWSNLVWSHPDVNRILESAFSAIP